MRQSQSSPSPDQPCVYRADGRPARRWAGIPASPPAEPDPLPPIEPPRTPELPPDKERPEIDDPPPDVVPVPVREPPSTPTPVAMWLTAAVAGRRRAPSITARGQGATVRHGGDWHVAC